MKANIESKKILTLKYNAPVNITIAELSFWKRLKVCYFLLIKHRISISNVEIKSDFELSEMGL